MASSSLPQVTKRSGSSDIGGAKEPLLNGLHKRPHNYSLHLAILPFLFPALEGLVYGYDIGATACATISLESPTLSWVSWYDLYYLQIGFITSGSVIMGIGMRWLPESPRWILLRAIQGKGDMHDVKETVTSCLCRLRGRPIGDSAPALVEEMLHELYFVGEDKKTYIRRDVSREMQESPDHWCRISFVPTGQPSVLYYAASIFQSAGFSAAADTTLVSILLGLFKLVMTGSAVLVVDRFGRRPLLLGGVSGVVTIFAPLLLCSD